MVRQQELARNPLQPSQGNSQPSPKIMEKQADTPRPASPTNLGNNHTTAATTQSIASPQPVFGRPTALGASPQPFARSPTQARPVKTGFQRQSSTTDRDQYAHLFLPTSKNFNNRSDLHKPRPGGNPLSQLNKPTKPATSSQSKKEATQETDSSPIIPPTARRVHTAVSRPPNRYSSEDDFFEIPKPATWKPNAPTFPTFSSTQNTNPFYQPRVEAVILDRGLNSGATSSSGIWDDRHGSSDPYTFMDAAKANEQLKALFEGGVDDGESVIGARKRKKQTQAKVDDLVDQIKAMKVGTDSAEVDKEAGPEEEEEEEEEEDDGIREGLKVKLLPHQIDGVEWMKTKEIGRENGKGKTGGGILADDMGLGKTIQSIALILTNPAPKTAQQDADGEKKNPKSDKGTLVVAPLALIKQWEAEIKDRIETDHQLKVCVHHGPKRTKSFKDLRKYDVVITTYSTLSSEHAASSDNLPAGCFGVKWYRIILDEAHSIKNRNAKSTKAACALNGKYRWCLTGTPMQNNLEELQSLIHFLRIAPLDKLEYWRDHIARPMSGGRGGLAIKRLQAVLANIMKRRTKDVLKQSGGLNSKKGDGDSSRTEFKLVKRTVQAVEADFSEHERSFYQRLESRTDQRLELMMAGNKMSYASALVLLMRLRQACNHPRLIGSDLMADKDSLAEGGSQSPRKKTNRAQDDDEDLVAMLGGLSVETKLCDVCQIELSKQDAREGALRCDECQKDLDEQEQAGKSKKLKKKDRKEIIKSDRKVNKRVIVDSDDDDDDDDDEDDQTKTTQKSVVDLTKDDEDSEENDEDDEESSDSSDDEDEDEDESEYDSEEANTMSDLISSTKIRHLLNILRNDSHKHKYIVFSVFTSMLNLIEPFLRESHINFARYDGSMRNDLREASLNNLRRDPTVRVLLCSLRAGALGLNLTAASRVVVLEPFWNPFVEEQAIDRVHRLNQTEDVVVYKLTIKDTVESRILELQEKKRALAQATVEGQKSSGVAKLNMAEMLKLFDHSAERDAKVDMVGMRGTRVLTAGAAADGESTDDPRSSSGGVHHKSTNRIHRTEDTNKPREKDRGIYSRRW